MQKNSLFLLQDTKELNETLVKKFTEDGINVVGQATDGIMAIGMIADIKPKVLITELVLSGYDGFKVIEKVKEICDKHQALIHASNILKKAEDCANEPDSSSKITKLNLLIPKYLEYVSKQLSIKQESVEYSRNNEEVNKNIDERVRLLNDYYEFFEENGIEGKGGFDARSKIRSTILEEFMYLIFKDYVNQLLRDCKVESSILQNGSVKAYSNLYFSAPTIEEFVKCPTIELNTKDQDYAIYRTVDISITNVLLQELRISLFWQ